MGLKTSFTIAIAAGAAVYGVQETKQQVISQCTGAQAGHVQVVNPNRYFGRNNLYISAENANGQVSQFTFDGFDPMGHKITQEAGNLCSRGQASAALRPRR